jgi:FixJ family two-component response regulator
MPGMTGPELAARTRTVRPGLPVLFISGYPDASVAQHGIKVDADSFVQKPFTAEILSGKIRQLIERT